MDFDSDRDLQFSPNRGLHFDLNRNLSFDHNRDLGFGKRGIIFRGYVCSSCGGLVNPMATECDECGATFVTKPHKRTTKKSRKKSRTRRKFCSYCGNPITGSDTYCSNCGSRLYGDPRRRVRTGSEEETKETRYDVVKLPRKGKRRTVTDWRETGKEFEDFLEK